MPEESILLVEDEDTIAMAFEYLLKHRGYRFRRVDTGTLALSVIQEDRPDAVILDVELAGCTGYEICQRIRSTPNLQNTIIVMTTARSGKVERQKCMAIGADDFYSKPFSVSDIVNSVETLLKERDSG